MLVNKMRYSLRVPFFDWEVWRFANPQRGDVITFLPPETKNLGNHYVKRVIALPNERIRLRTRSACQLQLIDKDNCDQENLKDMLIMGVQYQAEGSSQWIDMALRPLPENDSLAILNDSDDAGVLDVRYWPKDVQLGALHYLHNRIYEAQAHVNEQEKDKKKEVHSFLIAESTISLWRCFFVPRYSHTGMFARG